MGSAGEARALPFQLAFLRVFVDADREDAGVGGALPASLVAEIDDGLLLRGGVHDDEPRSLAVALHWGFVILAHSITSRLALLSPVRDRALPEDVTVEATTDLAFPDQEAFDAMLDVSQTNPERDQFVFDRAMLLDFISEKEQPLGAVLRVDGHPAAISWGSVVDSHAHIGYTGVAPAYRGRGLGYLVKQELHRLVHDAAARSCAAGNEEHNSGIRHLNEALGYVRQSGSYWLHMPA